MGETSALAEFTVRMSFDDVSADAVTKAKRAIRDHLGVALYGSQHGVGERISSYVDRCLSGDDAAVLGRGAASPPGAALANGAFGIAASSSSSLKKNFGTMTKPLHAGHAAQMGVRAASLAEAEFTADDAVFEGDIGYGEVMTPGGDYDPTEITEGLGETWAVESARRPLRRQSRSSKPTARSTAGEGATDGANATDADGDETP